MKRTKNGFAIVNGSGKIVRFFSNLRSAIRNRRPDQKLFSIMPDCINGDPSLIVSYLHTVDLSDLK